MDSPTIEGAFDEFTFAKAIIRDSRRRKNEVFVLSHRDLESGEIDSIAGNTIENSILVDESSKGHLCYRVAIITLGAIGLCQIYTTYFYHNLFSRFNP